MTSRLASVSANRALSLRCMPNAGFTNIRPASSDATLSTSQQLEQEASQTEIDQSKKNPPSKKTVAELDEELKQKMEGLSGGGGEAGLELEDGKPVAMKRGVRENMFRLI